MGISTGSTVQTSFRLPVDLHNQIKDIAVQQHDTFTDVLMLLARLGLQSLEHQHRFHYWQARAEIAEKIRVGESK